MTKTTWSKSIPSCIAHQGWRFLCRRIRAAALTVVIVVSNLGLGAHDARGQDEDEVESGTLSLTHLDAYFELEGDFTYRRVKRYANSGFAKTQTQRNREWNLEERIGLTLGGAILDPGFITFNGELSFALTQSRFKESGPTFDGTDPDSGYLVEYDLRANILPGKQSSGSVYGLQKEDRINRRFQPTLNQTRTGIGGNWIFTSASTQMELSYDYLETDRTGNADPLDDEHFTESTFRYDLEKVISEQQRLDLTYEHNESKQEYQGLGRPFETTRDLLTLSHEYAFGEDHQNIFRTLIHWQEESGDFARDLFEIGPQLSLKHSDQLQSLYKYQFSRERYDGLDIETHRADIQLVHQAYTNLTTTFDVFGLFEDVEDDVNTTQYGVSLDAQYNRRNRWGHLYANFAIAYDTEDTDGDDGERRILNEAHTFRDPVAITLSRKDVELHTIVVTDSSNRRIYRLGVDYAVFEQGNTTRIRRNRTGKIIDGETVLVDYLIRTPQGGQLDTIRVDFSLEQRFENGLTPYYRLAYRNQEDDVSTGYASRADRTDHHRMGAQYETTKYSVGAEFEIYDDTVEPYDAFHLNGVLHIIQTSDHTLDASARISRFFFEGGLDDRNVTMTDIGIDHRWRLGESLSTIERVVLRYEQDSVLGLTRGWDVTAGLEYVVGEFSSELTFEFDQLDLSRSDEDNYGVYFRIRRDLPNVLASR